MNMLSQVFSALKRIWRRDQLTALHGQFPSLDTSLVFTWICILSWFLLFWVAVHGSCCQHPSVTQRGLRPFTIQESHSIIPCFGKRRNEDKPNTYFWWNAYLSILKYFAKRFAFRFFHFAAFWARSFRIFLYFFEAWSDDEGSAITSLTKLVRRCFFVSWLL